MRDKYGAEQDHYCYPASQVLINILDIRDPDQLDLAELEFSEHRYIAYESRVTQLEDMNLEHFCHLHKVLFQDIYRWAGSFRDIDISKGNTRFCNVELIQRNLQQELKRIPLLSSCTNRDDFVRNIADIFCEINVIHPFREGNGRATRFFFEELVFLAGFELNWPDISKDEWVNANIQGYYGNLAPLESIFSLAISE